MRQLLFARLLRAAGSIWESRHKKKNVKMTDHFHGSFFADYSMSSGSSALVYTSCTSSSSSSSPVRRAIVWAASPSSLT